MTPEELKLCPNSDGLILQSLDCAIPAFDTALHVVEITDEYIIRNSYKMLYYL